MTPRPQDYQDARLSIQEFGIVDIAAQTLRRPLETLHEL